MGNWFPSAKRSPFPYLWQKEQMATCGTYQSSLGSRLPQFQNTCYTLQALPSLQLLVFLIVHRICAPILSIPTHVYALSFILSILLLSLSILWLSLYSLVLSLFFLSSSDLHLTSPTVSILFPHFLRFIYFLETRVILCSLGWPLTPSPPVLRFHT